MQSIIVHVSVHVCHSTRAGVSLDRCAGRSTCIRTVTIVYASMVQTATCVYTSFIQITHLQDVGTEKGGGAFTPGWAYTLDFTVMYHYAN